MAMSLNFMCRECPLNQTCFQYNSFEREKCKVYQARNVAREKVWEVNT